MSSKKHLEKLSKGFELPRPPERSTVSEEAAAKFLEPESGKVEAAKQSRPRSTKKPAPPKKRPDSKKGEGRSRLRRHESGERMSIYLPPEIAEQLRVRCALDRRSLSDAVTEAVAGWLD